MGPALGVPLRWAGLVRRIAAWERWRRRKNKNGKERPTTVRVGKVIWVGFVRAGLWDQVLVLWLHGSGSDRAKAS